MGGPNITAPISRRKKGRSSPIGLVCAALSAVFAFGGTFILAMAMLTKNDNGAPSSSTQQLVQRSALRQSSNAINNHNINNNNELPSDPTGIDKPKPKGLIIHTHLGDIRIHFTPEWAGETSINYIIAVVEHASQNQNSGMGYDTADTMNGRRVTEGYQCEKCKFYRAEKQLLLQGVLSEWWAGRRNIVELGPCPIKNYKSKLECPPHDPNCGCHGPIMTKGMVAWAGGAHGPDFFINTFKTPVDWWENQHTVWGEVRDEKSLKVVESSYDLPAHMSGMRMLDQEIEFALELF